MIGRATEAQLDLLHGLLAGALKDELERALASARDPENPTPINPQLLDKVMKFLAQNGVDAPKGSPKVDALADTLAALDVDLDAEAMGRPN
jgi:hypothetical protein